MPSDTRSTILPPPRPARGMAIRGLTPQLPERGKIKIGGLGDERQSRGGTSWRPPVKYNHFVITTLERGADGNLIRDAAMHAPDRFGEAPTSLPVRLLYDDPTLNFPTRYACYKGRTLWCAGDGASAQRLADNGEHIEVPCTCPLADPKIKRGPTDMRCKMNGALSVLIDGASGIGGVWKFRTTSYNSIIGLLSSMSFIRQVTGGPLANIPLKLTVQGRQAAAPDTGAPVQIFVVGLEFDGDMEALQDTGHRIALHRATTHLSIEHIEDEARRALMLAPPSNAPLPGDDTAEEIVAEYYPEQGEQMAGARPVPPRPTREQFEDKPPIEDDRYDVVDFDGVISTVNDPDEAADAWGALLRGVETADRFQALWDANLSLIDAFAAAGRDDLETEISQIPRPSSTPDRKETVAQGLGGPQPQAGEPRSFVVELRKPTGRPVDYEGTRGDMCALIMDLASADECAAFLKANRVVLAAMRANAPKAHEQVEAALVEKGATFA